MPRPAHISAAVLALAATGVGALPPGITPVNARQDDVNALSRGFGVPRADFRTPMNFEKVYRISSSVNLFGRGEEYFARASGGMWAVFPMSSYHPTEGGLVAHVPPGTVWLIGDPVMNSRSRPKAPDTRAIAPLDLRLDTAAPPPAPPRTDAPDQRTIWTSEIYRRQRISRLLDETLPEADRPPAPPLDP